MFYLFSYLGCLRVNSSLVYISLCVTDNPQLIFIHILSRPGP